MVQEQIVSSEKTNKDNGIHRDKPQLQFNANSLWQEYSFEDLFEIKNGLNKGKEYFGHGIPILNYMDVNKNISNQKETIDGLVDVDSVEIERYNVKPNDLFFTRTSETSEEIGLTSAYTGDLMDCVFSGFILRARPIKQDINSLFFAYYLRSDKSRNNIIKYSSITTRALISGSNLYKMKVRMPNIDEQNNIAGFLSAIDKKIELLEKKYEKYEKIKKHYLNEIFKSEKEFYQNLGYLCNIQTGKLDANAMVKNGKYRFFTCAKEYYQIDNYEFDTEALLISGNGANVGYIHYYNGKFNAYQRTYVLNNFDENIEIKYIKYYLEKNLQKQIWKEKKDSNTPYIVLSTLRDMQISFPDLNEQKKIKNLFINIDNKIDLINYEISLFNNFKKGLLQKMFV